MGFDCYVEITDIPGESADSNHVAWIDVLSVSFGASRPMGAGGRIAGRTEFESVTIVKPVDLSSVACYKALCEGKNLGTVVIHVCRTAGGQTPYEVVTLTDAKIADFSQTANGKGTGATPMPVDTVLLSYGAINFNYVQLDHSTGEEMGSMEYEFDVNANLEV